MYEMVDKIVNVKEVLDLYKSGCYSVHALAKKIGISDGKMYYILRDNGCVFNRCMKKKRTKEEKQIIGQKISKYKIGKKLSADAKEKISIANSCNYNGLNGYGHTKKHNQGYILAYAPKHPNSHKDGYVMLHTILMEQKLGRYLNSNEVVHHINHNKQDNRIENLQLMTKFEHLSMHAKEKQEKRRNDLLISCT